MREFNQQFDKFSGEMLDLRLDEKLFVDRSGNETLDDDCISTAECVVCCATNSVVDYSIPEDLCIETAFVEDSTSLELLLISAWIYLVLC